MYYRTAPRIEPGKGVIRRHWHVVVVGLGLERCVVGAGGMRSGATCSTRPSALRQSLCHQTKRKQNFQSRKRAVSKTTGHNRDKGEKALSRADSQLDDFLVS